MLFFSKRNPSTAPSLVNSPQAPASFRLRLDSTLTVMHGDPPRLTEAILSGYTPDELFFTRVIGVTSLPVLQPGEVIRIQGMDEGFTQVTLKAKVKESTRVRLIVTDMELKEHDQRRNRVRENIIRPAEIYHLNDKYLRNPEPCQLRDITLDGARVISGYDYTVGEKVRFRVELYEKAGHISSVGEIVRSRPMADGLTEYGILFANLTKERRRLFTADIQEVLRRTREGVMGPAPC